MRSRVRLFLAVLTLALWVVSGPIAMAFDGCAMMGAMCEAPCGTSSYIVAPTIVGVALLQPVAYLESAPLPHLAVVAAGPPAPPPKSSLLSA